MQRLVVAPRVYAFVETYDGKILNISDYIVRGEVRRTTNAVSTAQVTLRNPAKIWTPPPTDGNPTGSIFHPMDKITLFLEKIPNTPIQVFTGFLDRVPIYQMYPGLISLYASCTLKRLLYTYWDPALPFVYEFLAQYGWISDGNGNLTNYTTLAQGSDTILSYESQAAQDVANAAGHVTTNIVAIPPPIGSSGSVVINYGTSATNLNKTTPPASFTNFQPGLTPNLSFTLQGLNFNETVYYQGAYTITLPTSYTTNLPSTPVQIQTGGATTPPQFQLNDSSLSNVLYAVLQDIAGWDPSTVFIESLPNGMAEKLLVLYQDLAENESVTMQQLQNFLTGVIGGAAQGTGNSNASSSDPSGTVQAAGSITDQKKLLQKWSPIANKYNVPLQFAVAVGILESQLSPTAHNSSSGADGYFQMILGTKCYAYGPGSTTAATTAVTQDAALSCEWFCAAAQGWAGTNPSYLQEANWDAWAIVVQGITGHLSENAAYEPQNFPNYVQQAAILMQQTGVGANSITQVPTSPFGPITGAFPTTTSTPSITTKSATNKGGSTSDTTASSTSGYSLPLKSMPSQFTIPDSNYGGIDQGVILLSAKVGDPVFSISPGTFDIGSDGSNYIYHNSQNGNSYGYAYPVIQVADGPWKGRAVFYGYVQANDQLNPGQAVKAGDLIGHVAYSANNQNSGQGIVDIGFYTGTFGQSSPLPWIPGDPATPDAQTMLTNMQQLVQGNAVTPSSPYPQTGLANSQNTPNSVADLQSLSVSAAFNTLFNFPSLENTETALLLTGDKSYMNDQSILPFIQQLAQGCLRSFQSMPNGNIFVFFPDYFGAWTKRIPYWSINDIEILDGTIEVSDEALATHVFVSGDTIVANAGTVSPFDQVASTGVVSLTNAGISNFVKRNTSVNNSKNKTIGTNAGSVLGDDSQILSTPKDVLNFLKRYGVRPLVQDMPAIHSHYFELFVAYQLFQLMWARQFLSTFTFTFMPELYPGGLVAFPQHGISMYIDEVYHTFDYVDGFVTQANLMAPAALPNGPNVPFTDGLVIQNSFQNSPNPSNA